MSDNMENKYPLTLNLKECSSDDENNGTILKWISLIILENLVKYEDEVSLLIRDNIEVMPAYSYVIKHVELLKNIVNWQMKISPKELHERQIELRNAEVETTRAQTAIAKLEDSLKNERLKYDDAAKQLQNEIKYLNAVTDELRRRHCQDLEQETFAYRTAVTRLTNDVVEEKNHLVNRLHAHRTMLEKFTETNVEREKLLKTYCIKMERIRLVACTEYDRDLRKLHELKDVLEKQLRTMDNHCDILKNEYNVQSVLYFNLKNERELAMMQAFAEQIDNFKKKRAACIIQRNWRAYHERVSSKKKKKSRRNK